MAESHFKAYVVWLIASGKPEEALELLAKHYKVAVPALTVGLPPKHKVIAYGCYTAKNQTISVRDSDVLINPFVVLHEFYHHLRSKAADRVHRGTEGNADKFAMDFLLAYQLAVKSQKG